MSASGHTETVDADVRRSERCAECGDPAIVGFGEKPRWLCVVHFDRAMARVGRITRMVIEATEELYGTGEAT